jgi:hypothetical protein
MEWNDEFLYKYTQYMTLLNEKSMTIIMLKKKLKKLEKINYDLINEKNILQHEIYLLDQQNKYKVD